jgi:hypothetical protein
MTGRGTGPRGTGPRGTGPVVLPEPEPEEPDGAVGLSLGLALVGLDAGADERHEVAVMDLEVSSSPRQQDLEQIADVNDVPDRFTTEQQSDAVHRGDDLDALAALLLGAFALPREAGRETICKFTISYASRRLSADDEETQEVLTDSCVCRYRGRTALVGTMLVCPEERRRNKVSNASAILAGVIMSCSVKLSLRHFQSL